MKYWGGSLLIVALVITLMLFARKNESTTNATEPQSRVNPIIASAPVLVRSNHYTMPMPGVIRASDMTEVQRADLAKLFREKFKPAISKWGHAYAGHLPFEADEVTVDKFHSTVNANLYTFMVGRTTLTLQDMGDSARVSYMMTADGAKALNGVPHDGKQPDLSVPVSREDIIRMVKADRGIEFAPNQVEVRPSGVGSSLQGGEFVDVNRRMLDGGEVLDGKSYSMVFGPDGKLVNYEGPIF